MARSGLTRNLSNGQEPVRKKSNEQSRHQGNNDAQCGSNFDLYRFCVHLDRFGSVGILRTIQCGGSEERAQGSRYPAEGIHTGEEDRDIRVTIGKSSMAD